jgi:hypothetical protein
VVLDDRINNTAFCCRWICSNVLYAFLHPRLRIMVRVTLGQHYKIRKVSSG